MVVRSRLGTVVWLLTGVVLGVAATAGAVWGVSTLIAGDTPTEAGPAPHFTPVAENVGHVYDGDFQYFVGGGVAVFDCNSDGFPDLYFAGGSEPAGLYVNESTPGGSLAFTRLSANSTDLTAVTGAYPIDVDSDGLSDLAVLRAGENLMLRGMGDCVFERANEQWGIDGGDEWTASFSAKWDPGETLPTLVFGNYLVMDEPSRDQCEDHVLFRPDGSSYAEPERLSPGWCTLSVLFSDWDRSGNRDLRMTNDRHYYTDGEEQLWRVAPGSDPRPYTASDGWESMQIWGMGIASHDLTGDGRPEVFLTSQGDNKLQTLRPEATGPAYDDIALAMGATAHRPFTGDDTNRPSTAWHAEFGDVNNDGFIDLFVTKGNVEEMPDFAMDDPNNLLLGQPDGTFIEAAGEASIVDFARSRGGALADLDLDGRLDMVAVERREPVKIWQNQASSDSGNWIAFDLVQTGPNRDAIGSWIEVRLGSEVVRQEVTIGGGHAGGELGWTHFGLGPSDRVEFRVVWPDGEESPWMEGDANDFFVIDRENGTATPFQPVRD